MVEIVILFLTSLNPAWILLFYPLLFGSVALSCWREHLKKKLEANPSRMDNDQYTRFNRKRFNK